MPIEGPEIRWEIASTIGPCSLDAADKLVAAIVELPEFQAIEHRGGGVSVTAYKPPLDLVVLDDAEGEYRFLVERGDDVWLIDDVGNSPVMAVRKVMDEEGLKDGDEITVSQVVSPRNYDMSVSFEITGGFPT